MRILIWGTGEIAREFVGYLSEDVEIVGYINTNKGIDEYGGCRVFSPKEIFENQVDWDYIVVANVFSNEIWKELHNQGIDENKVIFLRPFQVVNEIDCHFRKLNLLDTIAPNYWKIAKRESGYQMGIDSQAAAFCNSYPLYQWDYYRYRTFELIADQLKDLPGAVAEAGVFKGYFSRLINSKFRGDRLYLFDSFEGFIVEEAEYEQSSGHCDKEFVEIFKDTSVETVLEKMPYKEQCVVKKGFFPQSAEGIEEVFKFVSIDFDFEQSIYDALKWFYPKMVVGGCIFIHDYNEPSLLGVKRAVQKYEREVGSLIKIPIADKCGTLIVYKI